VDDDFWIWDVERNVTSQWHGKADPDFWNPDGENGVGPRAGRAGVFSRQAVSLGARRGRRRAGIEGQLFMAGGVLRLTIPVAEKAKKNRRRINDQPARGKSKKRSKPNDGPAEPWGQGARSIRGKGCRWTLETQKPPGATSHARTGGGDRGEAESGWRHCTLQQDEALWGACGPLTCTRDCPAPAPARPRARGAPPTAVGGQGQPDAERNVGRWARRGDGPHYGPVYGRPAGSSVGPGCPG